jgi:GT2 family glycosyltransferase
MNRQDHKKASVIIPSFNRKIELDRCLKSVFLQDYENFELIVVDDGSNDNTSEFLSNHYPEVKVVRNENNLGAAEAKNQGVKKSTGAFLLFLDSDAVMLDTTSISTMIHVLEEDSSIGQIGGEVKSIETPKVRGYRITKRNGYSFPVESDEKNEKVVDCDFISTSNCMVRRDLFERLGGFDSFYFWNGEDKELGFKIKRLGFRSVAHPKVAVWHEAISKPTLSITLKQGEKTRVRFVLKNYEKRKIPVFVVLELRDLFRSVYRGDFKRIWYRLFAYLWNIVFLAQTISARLQGSGTLQDSY